MSIILTRPQVTERIQEWVDRGDFADADELVARAMDALEVEENHRRVRALIAEAEESVEQHGTVPWTPTLFAEILERAREGSRRGRPIPDHVKP